MLQKTPTSDAKLHAVMRLKATGAPWPEICAALDISRAVYYRRVKEANRRGIAYEPIPLKRSEAAKRAVVEALMSWN